MQETQPAMKYRLIRYSIFLFGIFAGALALHRGSLIEFGSTMTGVQFLPKRGSSSTYTELGCFNAYWLRKSHWLKESDVCCAAGVVPPETPLIKLGHVVSRSNEGLAQHFHVQKLLPTTDQVQNEIRIVFEFNFRTNTVTLVNTGESRPMSGDGVFIVFLRSDLSIEKWIETKPADRLEGVAPEVAEDFARFKERIAAGPQWKSHGAP
jgi:hypothetical protein